MRTAFPYVVALVLGCDPVSSSVLQVRPAMSGLAVPMPMPTTVAPTSADEDCVDPVAAGEEWYQKHDVSCPATSSSAAPGIHPTIPENFAGKGCRLLAGLMCGAKRRDLSVPELWRVQRAFERFEELECRVGTSSNEFVLRRASDSTHEFKATCPSTSPLHPHLPHGGMADLPAIATDEAVREVLELIHAKSQTSEYDHIEDAYHATAQDSEDRAGAIAMIVGSAGVQPQGECSKMNLLEISTLAPVVGPGEPPEVMCEGGAFEGDLRFVGRQCTAFFVAPGYLVTAGHCITGVSCHGILPDCAPPSSAGLNVKILGQFARLSQTEMLDAEKVWSVDAELVACEVGSQQHQLTCAEGELEKSDWALLRLPGVSNDSWLELADGAPAPGDRAHMLSHFANLPLKHSPEGAVECLGDGKFEMRVDGYHGSSGAPVFDKDKKVIGIFVEVEKERAGVEPCDSKDCWTLPLCPAGSCTTLPRASLLTGVRAALDNERACERL